jgi:hypothetical protein
MDLRNNFPEVPYCPIHPLPTYIILKVKDWKFPNLTVLTFPSELQTPRNGYPTSHFPVGGFRTVYYKASVTDRIIAQVLRVTLEVMSFTRYGPLIPSIAFLLW